MSQFIDGATETIRAHRDGPDIVAAQDDILIALSERRRVTCEMLVKLPPWRAVLIARVIEAFESQVVVQAEGFCPRVWPLEAIVAEAVRVGGSGQLVPPTIDQ